MTRALGRSLCPLLALWVAWAQLLPWHLHIHHDGKEPAAHAHVIDLHLEGSSHGAEHHDSATQVDPGLLALAKERGQRSLDPALTPALWLLLPLIGTRLAPAHATPAAPGFPPYLLRPPSRAPPG